MTTHDEDDQMAAAAAPAAGPVPGSEVVVVVDEAHQAFVRLGGATADCPSVAELLRQIIAAGRDTRVAFPELEPIDPRRPRRQYATLAELEAALYPAPGARVAAVPASHHEVMLAVIRRAGAAGLMAGEVLAEMMRVGTTWAHRAELYPALKRAIVDGHVVQPVPRGRYYWHENAPAPSSAHVCGDEPAARAACWGDPDCPTYGGRRPATDRDHAGLGLPCDVCGPRCTIDDEPGAGR